MSHASYLRPLLPRNFKQTVEKMAELIRKEFPDCNMIVGRGLSGAMVIPAIAAELNIEWALVRKERSPHSLYPVEVSDWNDFPVINIVFVDDLIDTGETYRAVEEEVSKSFRSFFGENTTTGIEFLGAACYLLKGVEVINGLPVYEI